jgi:GAF domain-containing protein
VNYRTPQFFSPEQSDVIESFATQAAVAIRNARLFQLEQEQRQQSQALLNDFQILHNVANNLAKQAALEQIYQVAVQSAVRTLNCSHSTIFILDKRVGELVAMERVGSLHGASEVRRFKPGEGLAGTVAKTGESMLINDAASDKRFIAGKVVPRFASRSIILAPIKIENEMVGVISADKDEIGGFTQHNLEMLETLALDVGIAINLRRQQDTLQAVAEFQRAISSLLPVQAQLGQIYEKMSGLMDTSSMFIALYEDDTGVIRFPLVYERGQLIDDEVKVEGRPYAPRPYGTRRGLTEWVIRHKEPLLVEDFETWAVGENKVEEAFRQDVKCCLLVPALLRDRIIGVIGLQNFDQPCVFDNDDRNLLITIANQMGIAIENARLYQDLERRVDALSALNEVGQTLTSGIRLREDEILELIYQQASKLTGTREMYIALYDEETGMIRFGPAMEKGQRVTIGSRQADMERRGKTEEVIFTRKPLLHKTEKEVIDWYQLPGHQEFRERVTPSWMGVPMMVGEKVLGVIAVYDWEREYAYDKLDLQVLASMASQAAIALDNAHLFYGVNQALERANRDLERQVGALSILNKVGQTLTAGIRLQEDEILELIYEQARRLTGSQEMYIALYDEEMGMIRFGPAMEKGQRVTIGSRQADMERRGKTEEVIITRQPLLHRTNQESKDWYREPGHQEFRDRVAPSWMGVPMMVGEKVLGVIAVYDWEREYAYDELDLQVLDSMASQAAIALDNAALLNRYKAAREELIAARQLAALGTVTAAIQHRINNTLNIIGPNITRLRKRVDTSDAAIQEILDIIERNTQYTSDYITRIQEPLKETEVQAVDINASLREAQAQVWGQYQDRAGFGAVEVVYNLDDSLPLIQASVGQITEIFRNLIENSYKAMGVDGGTLAIGSRRVDDWLEVEIQDTGSGIPSNIVDKLFIKPVPSRKPGEGSGLGLWLTNLLLQKYAGEISIEKTGVGGTTMLVRLPGSRP